MMDNGKKRPVISDEHIPAHVKAIQAKQQQEFQKLAEENLKRLQDQSGWDNFLFKEGAKEKIILDDKGVKVGCRGPKSPRVQVSSPISISEFFGETLIDAQQTANHKIIGTTRFQRKTGRPLDQDLSLRDLAISAAVELAVRTDEFRAINAAINVLSPAEIEKYGITINKIGVILEKKRKTSNINYFCIPDRLFSLIHKSIKLTPIHGKTKITKTIHEIIGEKYKGATIDTSLIAKIMKKFPGRGKRFKPSREPWARLLAQRAWLEGKKDE